MATGGFCAPVRILLTVLSAWLKTLSTLKLSAVTYIHMGNFIIHVSTRTYGIRHVRRPVAWLSGPHPASSNGVAIWAEAIAILESKRREMVDTALYRDVVHGEVDAEPVGGGVVSPGELSRPRLWKRAGHESFSRACKGVPTQPYKGYCNPCRLSYLMDMLV